ncbi:MAG TPA: cytochrome c peroxidase, partial [Agriterribacter sp.]|nr:cytochrome c peroxidase [Agriterribacter sp.]
MRKALIISCTTLVIFSGFAFMRSTPGATGVHHTLHYFTSHIPPLIASAKALRNAIAGISGKDTASIQHARTQLGLCRDAYKKIEFFTEYFFGNQVVKINIPPVFEVEEPTLEVGWPVGFQVIEELLFGENIEDHKKKMLDNTDVIILTAEGLKGLLYSSRVTDEGILESLRLELIRISTLNLTGFDAPLLKTGIRESATALLAFKKNIQPYLEVHTTLSDSISFYLDRSLYLLNAGDPFDTFNRMYFLTEGMLPLQQHTALLIKMLGKEAHEATVLNYDAAHLFDKRLLNMYAFDTINPIDTRKPLIALGKRLFFETKLSGNNKRSCGSCHLPEKYFTDGLKQSIAFDEENVVPRNAPSVLYTAYQYN